MSLVVVHVVVLGLRGWLSPPSWPWMLPPISLVAAVAAAVPLFVRRARERSRRNEARSSDRGPASTQDQGGHNLSSLALIRHGELNWLRRDLKLIFHGISGPD